MVYRFLADGIFVMHLGFVLFVALGGLLGFRWRQLAWLHIPSAIWGAVIEIAGWTCPLTPLENALRGLGGEAGYTDSFIERYMIPILYPGELGRTAHIGLGILVFAINSVVYWQVWACKGKRRH